MADYGCEFICVCNKMKCRHCLLHDVLESGSVDSFIHMKWELVRRRLSLRLLLSRGKCMGFRGDIHEAHEVFLQSISFLVSRNPFCLKHSSNFLLDLFEKDVPGDVLAVEHAATLYNICWFSLKSYPCKGTRYT
ncbi:unnamed protein product [Ilex paraguariensis]|uniref:Uncharacterized protein n=1 Tax=Ilex paraguariensis TaxID=185542 RepID=A0ABC8S1U9_9AQUA